MGKIRIYELARELNMTNTELVDRLHDIGYPVKSHMSSVDESDLPDIKAKLSGKKKAAKLEEKRIKPTVIRRRRVKTVKKPRIIEDPSQPEVVVEEEPTLAAEETTDKVPKETAAEALEDAVAPDEAVAESVEKETPEAKKPEPVKPVKKKKKDTPAKIIKPPPLPKETDPAEVKKTPAKPKRPVRKPIAAKPAPPAHEPSIKDKKKKGRKKTEPVEPDRKFFKKKISFRKKEVVEGKDLYSGRSKRLRKGKRGPKSKMDKGLKPQITTPKAIKRRIKIDDTIILAELAKRMGIKANEMIAKLMSLGVMATVNQTIDFDTAVLVSTEFGYELEKASFEEDNLLKAVEDDPKNLTERPPVVTIMGHVDHGKTSLLDVIRKTRVTELEAGGITQHIGAYNVTTQKGQIVFLDTPGHEAFSAMRSRGAKITDIVILVVAADDGVMPQTIEAINHSKAAGVPIIVAVNKIDKDNADPERVLRELSENGLVTEEWGGDTIFVKVSAKENIGIDDLLEMILLQTEMLELKANANKLARGHVVEAKLDAGRGPVATVLIQEGTLRAGDSVVCGIHYGKLRALLNDLGQQVSSAGPSQHRVRKQRSVDLAKTSRLSLDGLFEKMKTGEVKDLNLILKGDVHGSIEALKDSLSNLSNDEVNINIVHGATGTITESDISLAAVSNAIIVGFNVRSSPKVQEMANEEQVDIRYHNVIYDVIKEIQDAILGLMSSTFKDKTQGWAEIRDVFHIPKIGTIAGSYITEGNFERGKLVRLLRDGVIIYEGKLSSLRRFKDDVKEVQNGYECGIGIENFNDIKIGDTLECYYTEEIKPELD
ncbi:MAG: translation initiation factor IF-2 [Deltaproteobacteria bacterium]|nr:translation initiation factor IF-2 [Deltaproteobacteria bacterium]